jgi:hypothetical protein
MAGNKHPPIPCPVRTLRQLAVRRVRASQHALPGFARLRLSAGQLLPFWLRPSAREELLLMALRSYAYGQAPGRRAEVLRAAEHSEEAC